MVLGEVGKLLHSTTEETSVAHTKWFRRLTGSGIPWEQTDLTSSMIYFKKTMFTEVSDFCYFTRHSPKGSRYTWNRHKLNNLHNFKQEDRPDSKGTRCIVVWLPF